MKRPNNVLFCCLLRRRSQQKNKTLFGLFNQKSFEGLLIFISINNNVRANSKTVFICFFSFNTIWFRKRLTMYYNILISLYPGHDAYMNIRVMTLIWISRSCKILAITSAMANTISDWDLYLGHGQCNIIYLWPWP